MSCGIYKIENKVNGKVYMPKSPEWVAKIHASRAATLARRKSQTED